MGRLSKAVDSYTEKILEVRDGKKWICFCGLFLATLFRYFNIFLSTNGRIMLGISDAAGDGMRGTTSRQRENWYCVVMTVGVVAGLGLMAAVAVCWLLAWVFLFLSFVWCFQTDVEYELSYENKFRRIEDKMQRIRDERSRSNSLDYLRVFEEGKNARLDVLQQQRNKLILYKRQTDLIRYGRIPEDDDVEAQANCGVQVTAIAAPREPCADVPLEPIAANAVDDITVIDVPHLASFTNVNDTPESTSNAADIRPPQPENQAQGSYFGLGLF